jgi:hypothetical protein
MTDALDYMNQEACALAQIAIAEAIKFGKRNAESKQTIGCLERLSADLAKQNYESYLREKDA